MYEHCDVAIYLEGQIPPLEPQICGDVLVDRPSKFMIQLPCHGTEEDGSQSNNARTCEKEPVQLIPDIWFNLRWSPIRLWVDKSVDGLLDLCDLYAGVDDHADVVKA
jgi:hypothetical protein